MGIILNNLYRVLYAFRKSNDRTVERDDATWRPWHSGFGASMVQRGVKVDPVVKPVNPAEGER